jgi:predicted ATP-grasp superfamily ATP-dependent carboligase
VLLDACRRAGLPSASLWAAVPHYVQLAPSPRAALSLCTRLAELIAADLDTSELEEASERYAEQVTEAVSADTETAAYVEELEQRVDELDESELPSGESLAEQLSRYLREREEGDGRPGAGGRGDDE